MGIEDEMKRQQADTASKLDALFGGATELDEAQQQLKPLIDRLEGAREAQYQTAGRWMPTQDSAFRTDFSAVWTEGLPNLMDYVRAVFEPATSHLFFRVDLSSVGVTAPGAKHCAATGVQVFGGDYYLPTGSLHLRYEKGAVHFYKGWLKVNQSADGKLSVQVQQRLGGKYHDLETAYEEIFPVYARHVFHAQEDMDTTNRAYAALSDAWHGTSASSGAQPSTSVRQKPQASVIGTTASVVFALAAGVAAVFGVMWAMTHFGL